MKKNKSNKDAVAILESYNFRVIQFCEQGSQNGLFDSDELLFVNRFTDRVNEVDCIRAIQILRKEGFEVSSAQIRILIEEGIVEDPAGEVTFCSY